MQLRMSIVVRFFEQAFKEKYKLKEFNSFDKPAIFCGVYRKSDRTAIKDHDGPMIIYPSGSDTTKERNVKRIEKTVRNRNDRVVIAISDYIAKDLDAFNVPYERISLLRSEIDLWKPEPLGDSLYWYNADKDTYGKKYFKKIQEAFPDLNIITKNQDKIGSNEIPQEDMPEVYKKCFVVMRLTEHDGFRQTCVEAGLMGRKSIWNNKSSFSEQYTNIDDVIKIIKRLRKGYDYKKVAKDTKKYLLENEDKWKKLITRIENYG